MSSLILLLYGISKNPRVNRLSTRASTSLRNHTQSEPPRQSSAASVVTRQQHHRVSWRSRIKHENQTMPDSLEDLRLKLAQLEQLNNREQTQTKCEGRPAGRECLSPD